MNRRNFIVDFFLWLLAFLIGFTGKREVENLNLQKTDVSAYKSLNVKSPPKGSGLKPLKGDGTNEQDAFLAIRNYAIANLPMTLYFPSGTYGYTDLGNIAYSGLSIEGISDRSVIFKCLNTNANHTALNFDAFYSGQVEGFAQRCNMKNIIVEGNSETLNLIFVQGIARSSWENVYVRNGKKSANSKGFYFKGVMLSYFKNIMYSSNLEGITPTGYPYYGLYLDEGFRAGSSIGACSNNNFVSAYFEGNSVGVKIHKGDQNTFIGGSAEGCTVNGLLIGMASRYNTFIGTGFENADSTADVTDSGSSTQYINCYSSESMLMEGRGIKISGGLFARVELASTSNHCTIENITYHYFGTNNGGYYDSGTENKWSNLFDYLKNSYM